MNLKAFSKKDGFPSTSSKASKIGRPMTVDFIGSPLFFTSFTIEEMQKKKNIILKESNMNGVLGKYYNSESEKIEKTG